MIYGEHTPKFQSFLMSMRIERRRCTASSVAHVEVEFESSSAVQSFVREDNMPAGMNVVKCVSAEAACYFGHFSAATSAEITSSDLSEHCVAIGPQAVTIKGKPHFPSSSIFLWRTVFRDTVLARAVASWLAPSATGVGARAEAPRGPTSRGQAHSLDIQRYDSQKPLKQSPMVKKRHEANECVCCLDHPAEYKMDNCTHKTEGVALICLQCKTLMLSQVQQAHNSKRNDLKLPCPICRTCLLYTSPSPRDRTRSRMPSSA